MDNKEPVEANIEAAIEDIIEDIIEEGYKPIKLNYKKLLESELKENKLLKERIKTLEARHKLDLKRIKTLEATIENIFNK